MSDVTRQRRDNVPYVLRLIRCVSNTCTYVRARENEQLSYKVAIKNVKLIGVNIYGKLTVYSYVLPWGTIYCINLLVISCNQLI